MILTEIKDRVGIITLNRPEALNALCAQLIKELAKALDTMQRDKNIGCIIITGNEKAFAAGADIKEMMKKTYMDVYMADFITNGWEHIITIRKPVIAAVQGFALGGGCEIAMMCDFILAAPNAKFGQPEITLGITPGAGGSQRMARYIGKSKAMEMCLTGRMMDAQEAERCGLVSRIIEGDFMAEVLKTAQKIAQMSQPITYMVKECVNMAFETHLTEGVKFERRVFHACFATKDQKEGMKAFSEKRKAQFNHQ